MASIRSGIGGCEWCTMEYSGSSIGSDKLSFPSLIKAEHNSFAYPNSAENLKTSLNFVRV